jgi:hypothetical protein
MSKKYPGGFVTNLGTVGYSVFFDGTGDRLSLTGTAVGNSNVTIEFWVYPTDGSATYRAVIDTRSTTGTDTGFGVFQTGRVIEVYGNGLKFSSAANALNINAWNHVALTRSSGTCQLYVNGASSGSSATYSSNLTSTAIVIGDSINTAFPFIGYISNLRIVIGSVLYTAAFTPPTQLLNVTNTSLLTCNSPAIVDQSSNNFAITVTGNAAVSTFTPFPVYNAYNPALGASTPGVWTLDQALQAAATRQWNMYDPYFNLTTLYLPGNGTNGAQNNTFLDSSTNNFTITRNGNTTQGTFSPFSQTGWSVNHGVNNYWQAPASTNWDITGAAFTVEMWVYLTSFTGDSNQGVFFVGNYTGSGGASGWSLGATFGASPVLNFSYWNGAGGTGINSTGVIPLNAWTHVAFTRSGSTLFFYINGISVGTAAAPSIAAGDKLTSGAYVQNFTYPSWVYGSISNLRIIKGTALYSGTGSFTPPTGPLTAVPNTVFLGSQSNRFVDNGPNAVTITPFGTLATQPFAPFAPTTAYSAATVGGSGYFDGSGDYLTGNGSLSSSTSMSTFTVEGWIYPTTFANTIWVVGDMQATSGVNALAVNIGTNGDAVLYWFDGAVKTCTSTTFMRLNQWNWFAVVVNSNAISIYVNSTTPGQAGTTTLTNRTQTTNFSVGQWSNSTTPAAYISSLRWSNGIARTISSIPTAPYTSDANTRLLLNFTNAGITDATSKNVLETVGNAQISTTQSKFGGSSMLFDGTGDWLIGQRNPDLSFGTGSFTMEGWAYVTSVDSTYRTILSIGSPVQIYARNGTIECYFNDSDDTSTYIVNDLQGPASSVAANTWFHFAVVRNGTTFTAYVNGVAGAAGTGVSAAVFYSAQPIRIGVASDGSSLPFTGYIDDLRITKGYARYTTNFTPPTSGLQQQ